jgi:hypothetical protein
MTQFPATFDTGRNDDYAIMLRGDFPRWVGAASCDGPAIRFSHELRRPRLTLEQWEGEYGWLLDLNYELARELALAEVKKHKLKLLAESDD